VHLFGKDFHQLVCFNAETCAESDGLCYNPHLVCQQPNKYQGEILVFLSFRTIILFTALILTSASLAFAQNVTVSKEKTDKSKKEKPEKPNPKQPNNAPKVATAEQVAESVIFIYGGLQGRQNLNQIRKTTLERGKISITDASGKTESANYERWILRGDSLNKERIRFDQTFPDAKFALVYNSEKIFGLYNDSVFTPREDASNSFQNQIWHGLEALLRYKENESKLELSGHEKLSGVDFYLLDVIDKQNRKTRFFVSSKSYRVMLLEYEESGIKYKRKFYDYNYAQGTLVPYRTVLWANEKQIEEINVGTITFGQKIEDSMFQQG
jgi:hypothetical protein